jgi:phosphate transport system protein
MFDLIGNALKTGNITGLKEELTRLDDEVDGLYNKALEILKETVKRDPQTVDVVVDLIFVARHLERIADILSKIGARIIFIEKGVRVWIK